MKKLAILSRNPKLYSVRRLVQEAEKLKIDCHVINPLDCQLLIEQDLGGSLRILSKGVELPKFRWVLPRIGASITEYGLTVLKHLECLGVISVNSAQAIANSRNKMTCLQVLASAGLPVPSTAITRSMKGLRASVESVKGFPIVLKILQGTQGLGVMLVHTPVSLGSVVETLRSLHQDVLIQEFIREGAGRDFRALVIGGSVFASMMRTAPVGEFRANLHLGGEADPVRLPEAYHDLAVAATRALGLEIAGVDILESQDGPLVIEVNSSPGFEGIEKASQQNVAKAMMRHIVNMPRKIRRKS